MSVPTDTLELKRLLSVEVVRRHPSTLPPEHRRWLADVDAQFRPTAVDAPGHATGDASRAEYGGLERD
jgi:hypothetical protein